MAKFKLKTIERETSVTREAVRAAVAEVFKNDKSFNFKEDKKNKPGKGDGKEAA